MHLLRLSHTSIPHVPSSPCIPCTPVYKAVSGVSRTFQQVVLVLTTNIPKLSGHLLR